MFFGNFWFFILSVFPTPAVSCAASHPVYFCRGPLFSLSPLSVALCFFLSSLRRPKLCLGKMSKRGHPWSKEGLAAGSDGRRNTEGSSAGTHDPISGMIQACWESRAFRMFFRGSIRWDARSLVREERSSSEWTFAETADRSDGCEEEE